MAPTPPLPKPQDRPHVERHDEVYFRDSKGTPWSGKVLSAGEHGCTLELPNGKRHQVVWDGILGHRKRMQPELSIVDQGEDGFVAKDQASGRLRYIEDPLEGGEEEMAKAFVPRNAIERLVAMRQGDGGLLAKALKNAPGLSLQQVTTKGGVQTQRWKKTAPDQKKPRQAAAPKEAPKLPPVGHHDAKAGDTVRFKAGDFHGSGKILAFGHLGASVQDGSGRVHEVKWAEIHERNGVAPKKEPKLIVPGKGKPPETAKPAEAPAEKPPSETPEGGDKPIDPAKFSATEYAKSHDDPNASVESILSHFPPDTAAKIRDVKQQLEQVSQTIDTEKPDGEYSAERQALHRKILFDGITAKVRDEDTGEVKDQFFPGLLSPEAVAAATPPEGQKPTFTMLGGRGGSGKSWFTKHGMVDKTKAIFLDNDHIKSLLPEYDGWNAAKVHEEASDLFDDVTKIARHAGLNVVHDATMKTGEKAIALLNMFKEAGYRVEAHYMHLPRQEAAKRAIGRFLGPAGRFVPPEVVLGMTSNEDSFDQVRPHVDKWSFRDNNVPRGEAPKLISQSDGND